jgi:hypothetical protein
MSEATMTLDKIEGAIEVLEPWPTLKHWAWSFQGKRAIEIALLALRSELARMREAELPKAECTGVAAVWCPRCGDCSCDKPPGVVSTHDNPRCPLHGESSEHAEVEPRLAPPHGVAQLQSLYAEHRQALPLAFVREFPAAMALIEETLAALCADRLELEKLRRVKYLADCPPAPPLEAMALIAKYVRAGDFGPHHAAALSEIESFMKAVSR